ncbi:hypothetical protein [Bacillus cereus]|uniref:hypothetical protein n=1 Tax=Bacillus cereus TaxID=1396 RepID=UPI0015D475B9|nr:hypothetical protein [Bacillus cereus]
MDHRLLTGIVLICVSIFLTVVFVVNQNLNTFYTMAAIYFVIGLIYVSNYVRSKK